MSSSRTIWDKKTEIRKIVEGDLSDVLRSIEGSWETLMKYVPKNVQDIDKETYEFKYTAEHISLIKKHGNHTRTAQSIFIEEWATSGKIRPTLETLQKLLTRLNLYNAMCAVAVLIGEPRPPRSNDVYLNTNVSEILLMEDLKNIRTLRTGELTLGKTYNNNMDHYLMNSSNTLQSTERITNGNSVDSTASSQIPVFVNSHTPSTTNNRSTLVGSTYEDNVSSTESNLHDIIPIAAVDSMNDFPNQGQDDISADNDMLPLGVLEFLEINGNVSRELPGKSFSYQYLDEITNKFAPHSKPSDRIGGLVGEGGFGKVYVGFDSEVCYAVKRLTADYIREEYREEIINKIFKAELKMVHYKHENILIIMGYCLDGPEMLIVSEYIDGGDLEKNLRNGNLNEQQRLKIITGTANGLQYLHFGTETPMVHKDVKSKNILLTKDFTPKLCDFGTTREDGNQTRLIMGTNAYLDPLAQRGTLTAKMDVYSFGIVLLEILTGLRAIIQNNNNEIHIIDYLDIALSNKNDITPLLDSPVKDWAIANKLYDLSIKCTADFNERPDSRQVCKQLQEL